MGRSTPLNPAVHPHIRGAYVTPVPGVPFVLRFIPTYVGHTGPGSCPWRPRAVHPHIRGAYIVTTVNSASIFGSSPPTWGIPAFLVVVVQQDRFIPTYVGHTSHCLPHFLSASVHPHLRGAYPARRRARLTLPGSSPPTWGIRSDGNSVCQGMRFIPTYVGHTSSMPSAWNWLTVHPHLRGAYLFQFRHGTPQIGSSPPTWGIRKPAPPSSLPIAVHPHLRGAYRAAMSQPAPRPGSSPPTWGILDGVLEGEVRARFIPTYVGHTLDRRKKNGWFQPLLL